MTLSDNRSSRHLRRQSPAIAIFIYDDTFHRDEFAFAVLVRLHGIVSRRDNGWSGGGPRERRRDTPSTPAVAAAAGPRAGAGAAQQPGVRRCDKSESEPEPAEIAALARFRQTERRRQDPDTEDVSDVRLDGRQFATELSTARSRGISRERHFHETRARVQRTERPPIRGSAVLHRHYK